MAVNVAFVLVVSSLVAGAMGMSTVSETLDAMLIQPFCKRSSVKGIMDICVSVAPEKEANVLKGTVTADTWLYAIRGCGFQIKTKFPEEYFLVTCNIGDQNNNPQNNWVAIYPLETYQTSTEIRSPATESVLRIRAAFQGGAIIIIKSRVKVSCSWEPLPSQLLPDDVNENFDNWTD